LLAVTGATGWGGFRHTSFEEDLAHATRVTYESWKNRGLKAKLLEVFVFPLESQL
jgi:hypothetical protein